MCASGPRLHFLDFLLSFLDASSLGPPLLGLFFGAFFPPGEGTGGFFFFWRACTINCFSSTLQKEAPKSLIMEGDKLGG